MTAALPGGPGVLFGPGPVGGWDSERVSCPRVLREPDGRWKMWYYGRDPTFERRITLPTGRIGLATSADGLHWLRLEGPHRGAMLAAGAAGEFDEIMAAWPQVLQLEDGTWRMYYHGLDRRQRYTMGWAESADRLYWRKRGPLLGPGAAGRFDDAGVATRHILRFGPDWVMFYEGCRKRADSPIEVDRQIGVATSRDGLDWQRLDGPGRDGCVLEQAPRGSGRWDHQLGCPWVVAMPDRSLRLYYIGSNERRGGSELDTVNQIGLAVSDGDWLQWRRHEAG